MHPDALAWASAARGVGGGSEEAHVPTDSSCGCPSVAIQIPKWEYWGVEAVSPTTEHQGIIP